MFADYMTKEQLRTIREKYRIPSSCKPKWLGEGGTASCFSLGPKKVIKFFSCRKTFNAAVKIQHGPLDFVAKVYLTGKVIRPPRNPRRQVLGRLRHTYFVVQERVKMGDYRNDKLYGFCRGFSEICELLDEHSQEDIEKYVSMARQLKSSGIDPARVDDLYEDNVGLAGKQIKILDLGSLVQKNLY